MVRFPGPLYFGGMIKMTFIQRYLAPVGKVPFFFGTLG
jgi:hypothetical protein